MTKRSAVIPLLKMKPPRLTTRKFDAFTDDEFAMLSIASERRAIWIAHGDGASKLFTAAHALQRLGYLAPRGSGKPDSSNDQHGHGWKITEDGREALVEAMRRKAA